MNAAPNNVECPHTHRHRLEYLFIHMAGQAHSRFNSSYIFAMRQSQHLSAEHTFEAILTPTFNPFIFKIHRIFKVKRTYRFVIPLLQPKVNYLCFGQQWPHHSNMFAWSLCWVRVYFFSISNEHPSLFHCSCFKRSWSTVIMLSFLKCYSKEGGGRVRHAARQLCLSLITVLLDIWHGEWLLIWFF